MQTVTISLWVVLACTILTLFFSVAHYTLRSPSRVRMEQAFSGARRSRWLDFLDRKTDLLLLATGVLRLMCHLGLLLAMLYIFERGDAPNFWPNDIGALALTCAIVAVFGIGIPHAWAKYAGESALAAMYPVLVGSAYVFYPVTRGLALMDGLVRRLSGHRQEDGNGRTNDVEQEILQLANEGQADGTVDPDEKEMIESVIEFGEIRVGEIMTPRTDMVAIAVTSTRTQCQQIIREHGHSRIPVYEETLDQVVGVLYAKDLLTAEGACEEDGFDLRRVMRRPFFVPETKSLRDLLREFKAQKVHMAILLDEYGGTAGLVTIEDLLEEIVGELADEYEPAEPAMLRRLDGQTVEVDARMYIDDLNDALDIELPEDEDYDTVGGFVFTTLGYIPKSGEALDYDGAHITVIEAEERKINRLRIQVRPGEQEDED